MADFMAPVRLDLKKDEKLEVEWSDGRRSVYTIAKLRAACPCALCRGMREYQFTHVRMQPETPKRPLLTMLPRNSSKRLGVVGAGIVRNYARRLDWSGAHRSRICSWPHLREV